MAKDRDYDRDNDAREDNRVRANLGKDLKPSKDEGINEYYTRKVRTADSVLAPDGEQVLVDSDDSFAESRNYPNPDAGPMNYKKWDRYGK